MSINGIIGEQVSYEGLAVGILNEAEGSYRIVIIGRASEFSSSCAGYTAAGIRERALELAYAYLLKRDGAARKPSAGLVWKPIRIDIDPPQRQSD
jgi:hypothetical protein